MRKTITAATLILALGALPTLASDLTVTFEKSGKGGTLPEQNASCIAADGKAARPSPGRRDRQARGPMRLP